MVILRVRVWQALEVSYGGWIRVIFDREYKAEDAPAARSGGMNPVSMHSGRVAESVTFRYDEGTLASSLSAQPRINLVAATRPCRQVM